MTRGCRQLKALIEAEQIALDRGAVGFDVHGMENFG